jgi:hypothetical protein
MDEAAVEQYVERSRSILEASPQMNEENTKVKLVQPFIEILGWKIYSTEVELEYSVPMATQQSRVDYALLIGSSPTVFIEAKSSNSTLSEGDIDQLKSYMRQKLDVGWGVLTNGKQFEVLAKANGQGTQEEISVAEFELRDLEQSPDILEILSKDAIQSGRADEIAEQVANTNQAIQHLTENQDTVAQRVADAVGNEISEAPLDFNEQAIDFVQDLVSTLRERRRFIGESTSESGETAAADVDSPPEEHGDIQIQTNKVAGTILREHIRGDDDAKVAVFPTQTSGVTFLKENAAWGFVRVGQEFDYVAMYVTGDVREVRYFASVRRIVPPEEADLQREPAGYVDRAKIADDKMVVEFESESLYELEDPIPYETKYLQSLQPTFSTCSTQSHPFCVGRFCRVVDFHSFRISESHTEFPWHRQAQ